MSRRFNPVSAGVAAVTATVILGIAGCAMGTRTETTDQTDSAGLSREANANSQAPVQGDTSSTMPGTTAMDTPAMDTPASPPTTVALPAEPAPAAAPMANDTAAIPPTDTSQPMASTSTYPSNTASTSSTTAVNTTPSTPSTSSSSGTTPTTSGSDMSSGSSYSSDSSLPPRTDRN